MNALTVSGLTKSFGARVLFENLNFSIPEKSHIGLIGNNGSGKTTLFSLISGAMPADSGTVSLSPNTQLGFLEQFSDYKPTRSLYEETLSVFDELKDLEQQLRRINADIDIGTGDLTQLISRQHALQEDYQRRGGLTYQSRTRAALLGMGFSEADLLLPMRALSGGQQSKAQMAKLLLSGAGFLLLDEPTNHLDIAACEWMEAFLSNYPGAFIVISHDRYFLDRVTNHTLELAYGSLFHFKGNYTQYQSHKAQRLSQERQRYKNMQKEVERLENMIVEMRRWNREKSVKAAESKQKVLDNLQREMQKPPADQQSIAFEFPLKHRGGNDVLTAEGLSMAFDAPLFQDVSLKLERGDRAFLIGPNGCGKTTLLRVLTGQLCPGAGSVDLGAQIDIGYFDQSHADLNPQNTALEEVWTAQPRLTQSRIRTYMAAFLFEGDEVFKKVAMLSGGERARIALLRLMLQGANLLLLDEPTNHLDLNSREALEQALSSYQGTILVISHDRYLINRLAQKVYALQPEGLTLTQGNYDDYLNALRVGEEVDTKIKREEKPSNAYQIKKRQDAEVRRLKKRITEAEQAIQAIENEIAQVEAQLNAEQTAADYQKAMELTGKQAQLLETLDAQLEAWEQYHEALSGLE